VEVLAALARLAWERGDWRRGRELAALTLAEDDRGSGARTTALVVEANSAFELRDHPAAIVALEELTKLRRRSDDWVLLGRALGASGRLEEAAVALAKAADIQPFRAETRLLLAGTYERLERVAQAKQQRTVAEALARGQP
jgi:tetratricopeptide (TPR) repeat protein